MPHRWNNKIINNNNNNAFVTNRTERTKFHKVKGLCGAPVASLAPDQEVVCSDHVEVKLETLTLCFVTWRNILNLLCVMVLVNRKFMTHRKWGFVLSLQLRGPAQKVGCTLRKMGAVAPKNLVKVLDRKKSTFFSSRKLQSSVYQKLISGCRWSNI